jgi:BolA family transcriptional regulator, general stress-responsive regulator
MIMEATGEQTVRERMKVKLSAAFAPEFLQVIDESDKHAGHAGGAGHGGETHFRVQMVAPAFIGKSRVERHRAVNSLLAEEIAGGVHALALITQTPEEAKR